MKEPVDSDNKSEQLSKESEEKRCVGTPRSNAEIQGLGDEMERSSLTTKIFPERASGRFNDSSKCVTSPSRSSRDSPPDSPPAFALPLPKNRKHPALQLTTFTFPRPERKETDSSNIRRASSKKAPPNP